MKRMFVVAASLMLLAAVAPGAVATPSGSISGARRTCTRGPVRCFALVATRDGALIHAASPNVLPTGYGPDQYHTAYQLPTQTPLIKNTTNHKNVKVSIVDAYDDATILTDLNTYSAAFGLPTMPQCTSVVKTSCFKKVNMGAAPGSAVAKGWDIEIALDVETVHAICENCKIVLVESTHNSFVNLGLAVNKAASVSSIVSNSYGSYGWDGYAGSPFDGYYDHPNKAIIVSAGDSGYGAAWPAVLNTVVSVGGTALTVAGDNSYVSETVWGPSSSRRYGTGSGCADGTISGAPVPAQAFQSGVANYANTGCGTSRGMNDVAANADPNTGSAVYAASTGWIQVGGTSLAAPLIAGVFALKANVAKAAYPASFLYAKNGTASFNDVTTGSDDAGNYSSPCDLSTTACLAAPGYDLPTGVGTPRGTSGF